MPTSTGLLSSLGRFFGRIVATVGVASIVRLLGKRLQHCMHPNREEEYEDGLMDDIQLEIPVAAATIQAWNSELGADQGAEIFNFLVNNMGTVLNTKEEAPAQLQNNNLQWLLVNYAVAADRPPEPLPPAKTDTLRLQP